ncbi:unnamed protein product [Menidia menidia]|uniref:(Atlantic silverside) hypothetical protein n=1 Tax=Menidia menidia TaxID=238744 RepID=A0A8S4AGI9_9TELE|nr:unnamed protein product [Menidia menidia]
MLSCCSEKGKGRERGGTEDAEADDSSVIIQRAGDRVPYDNEADSTAKNRSRRKQDRTVTSEVRKHTGKWTKGFLKTSGEVFIKQRSLSLL